MILFIHGLSSSNQCSKCILLQKFSSKTIIPTLDLLEVKKSLEELEMLVKQDVDLIVGASFGGFYAQYLAKKYHKDLILINPVNDPLALMQAVDLKAYDIQQIVTDLQEMVCFITKHNFTAHVEVLIGLYDDVILASQQHHFFRMHSCKYYADDHKLLAAFGSYLEQSDTLLSKYLEK